MSAWDWENVWQWNDETNLPELRNANNQAVSPTISAISASPATGGQTTEYTLSVSATTEAAGGIASYQWYGRIGSSGEWTPISGATAATYQFVPGDQALGDIYFKAVVTGADGGVVDSYDAGYTDVKITIVLAPQISNAAANPTTGPLTQTVQLSADVTSTTTATYQWQEQLAGTWTNIQGATSATYSVSIADTAATLHSYRLLATDTGGTTPSATVTYQSYAPPTVTGASVNPATGKYTETITLDAAVTGADSLQWQRQTGSTWENIEGATTETWIGALTFTGDTNLRLKASNIGGTTYSSIITYTIAGPANIQTLTASPNVVSLPGTTTLTITGTNIVSVEWQKLISGTWTTIGTGLSLTDSPGSTAGTITYRALVEGADGTTVTSNTIEVLTGYAPTVEIIEPTNQDTFPSGATVELLATISGTDVTFRWDFGDGTGDTTVNPTSASFNYDGYKTITLRAESIFGSTSDSITFLVGKAPRPMYDGTVDRLDDSLMESWMDALTPEYSTQQPDIMGIFSGMLLPYFNAFGTWFFLLLFAVPYLIIWVRQKNIIIPSILGVLFAAWILVQFPSAAVLPTIGILVLAISGGIYGIYVKYQR